MQDCWLINYYRFSFPRLQIKAHRKLISNIMIDWLTSVLYMEVIQSPFILTQSNLSMFIFMFNINI